VSRLSNRNRGKIDKSDTETEAKWITLTHIYMTDTETEAKWITLTHIYMTDTETEAK
jgi:hypothetical protein